MLQAIAIMVREGFEAALVIGILLTYAAKTGREHLRRPMLWGAGWAVLLSALIALGLSLLGVRHESPLAEAGLHLIASVFVVSMVVWMWRAGGDMRDRIIQGVERGRAGARTGSAAVAVLAFFMVAREGIEAVLFLAANSLDQGFVPTLVGGAIGLAIAVGLGIAVYYGAARIDLRVFFSATSVALLLLAARFLGIGIHALAEAGAYTLPTRVSSSLEQLEVGTLATVISVIIVALPLGAIGWSLLRSHLRRASS